MDAILRVDPGLMIWTILNFCVFLFLLIKFGTKPIVNGLKTRENAIQASIDNAAKANEVAQKFLKESDEKLNSAQKEMSEIIKKGREQAEEIIKKSAIEAEAVKKLKVEEAIREIEHGKEIALKELRSEVAGMVVMATEKILGETLDQERHFKLIESSIEQLPKN